MIALSIPLLIITDSGHHGRRSQGLWKRARENKSSPDQGPRSCLLLHGHHEHYDEHDCDQHGKPFMNVMVLMTSWAIIMVLMKYASASNSSSYVSSTKPKVAQHFLWIFQSEFSPLLLPLLLHHGRPTKEPKFGQNCIYNKPTSFTSEPPRGKEHNQN